MQNKILAKSLKMGMENSKVVNSSFLPEIFDRTNLSLNIGGSMVGLGSLLNDYTVHNNRGDKVLSKILTNVTRSYVGTQASANILKGLGSNLQSFGSKIGFAGLKVSTGDILGHL
jgi:hypothetical protein